MHYEAVLARQFYAARSKEASIRPREGGARRRRFTGVVRKGRDG